LKGVTQYGDRSNAVPSLVGQHSSLGPMMEFMMAASLVHISMVCIDLIDGMSGKN
jgi:hypothetical protein